MRSAPNAARTLDIDLLNYDGRVLAEAPLDEAGRGRLASALADYVLTLDENPLRSHPDQREGGVSVRAGRHEPLQVAGQPARVVRVAGRVRVERVLVDQLPGRVVAVGGDEVDGDQVRGDQWGAHVTAP